MLRRHWKPLVAVTLIGPAAYYFYRRQETFRLAVRTLDANGQRRATHISIPLLTKAQVDARLAENASFQSLPRPGGLVWNISTASLPSNDPIEDAHANEIVARDTDDPGAPGDLLFLAVMDGHGGPYTSRLLSKILIRAVASELSLLAKNPAKTNSGLLQVLKSAFQTPASVALQSNQKQFSFAIQNAFTELDRELINAPLRVLASSLELPVQKKMPLPELSKHPLGLASMQPAVSGPVFPSPHLQIRSY